MKLDTIIRNADIRTLDAARPRARDLGIWRGRIVGLDEDLDGLVATEEVDAHGATVLPGFIDSHTHLALTGQRLRSVDIGGLTDRAAALARIAAAVTDTGADDWIEVGGYEHSLLGSHLTAQELETAAPGRRVYVRHISGHAGVVSPAVLAQIPPSVRENPRVESGLLEEADLAHLRSQLFPYPLDRIKEAIVAAAAAMRREGVTMAMDAGVGLRLGGMSGVDILAYQELRDAGELPVRVQVMPELLDLSPQQVARTDGFSRGIPWGIATGLGDDMLRVGAAKVQLDGGLMVHSAALTEDYLDGEGRGWLIEDAETFTERIVDAHTAGWQLAIHAIGDASIDVAIAALEECARIAPRRRFPHRIEHASVVRPDQAEALGRLGVAAVVQPCFIYNSLEEYLDMLGPQRESWMYRWRSLEAAGARLVSSTDRPLLGSPLEGIRSLVRRTSARGTVTTPSERIGLPRAIETWTVDGAWVAGMADRLGRLRRGYLADLVLLDTHPESVAPERIRDVPVVATMVDGELQWH
ncbi:amidohydrolase [Microbacterium sp.]|uniref:amidohydrolase n=1 Tax=Microbacterium sp. TaxID=51671 RepID=UPI003C7427CE